MGCGVAIRVCVCGRGNIVERTTSRRCLHVWRRGDRSLCFKLQMTRFCVETTTSQDVECGRKASSGQSTLVGQHFGRERNKRETNKHRDEEIRGWPESTRRTSTSFGRLRKLLSRFFFDALLAPSRPGAASPPRCAMSVDADMFSVPRMPAPFCVRSLRLFP